jgi:cell wall-associated NlpC family hydrolase
MVITTLQNFDDAIARMAARQRSERLRAWLAVVLPASLGAAFLAFGAWQLKQASAEVDGLHAEAAKSKDQIAALKLEIGASSKTIAELQDRLRALEDQLKETTELTRFKHPMDLVDLKAIYSSAPKAAPVLGEILALRDRNVSWLLGGTDPKDGFDSPSFAAYVLQRSGALPAADAAGGDRELLARSRRLQDTLPSADSPQPGDVVFYPAGYALFWFLDQRRQPFVIGMTPSGIIALEPNFADRVAVRRPSYR